MSKFNAQNTGHLTGSYPLFLGESLGVVDTINIKYPQLEDLYQTQLSQIWNEFEVDLTQDRMDMLEVPEDTKQLMVKTILWQTVADSVASRSILETLGQHVSNSELMNLLTLWGFFEVIHARTYSHIIKQTFSQPNEMIEKLYQEAEVLQRSDIIVQTFDDMAAMNASSAEPFAIRCQILRTITALFALEAIAFMSSFAVTFAITETGKFTGIGQLVKLICRDEVLHTRMDYAILDILKNDPEWKDAFAATEADMKGILDSVVLQEMNWADYLFSEGREVIGLNAVLLKEYTAHMSAPLYKAMGLECSFDTPSRNPLPYMDKYINSTKVQAAAQEVQLTSYKVGSITDDTSDLDLDFDM